MALAVKALAGYPDNLLGYLADPVRGIVRKSKFIPAIAEMCVYMDREGDRLRKAAEQDERDRRRALPSPAPIVSDEHRTAVLNGLRNLSADIRSRSNGPAKDSRVAGPDAVKAEAEEWLRREMANPRPLPKLSRLVKL